MKLTVDIVMSIVLMLVCGAILWRWIDEREYFDVYPDVEERIINVYEDVLHRQPTSAELVATSRDVKDNAITWDGLRQRLMDSDEYERMIKLQSNALAPELDKMLADARVIKEISAIYQYARKRQIPSKMILPLRDLYVTLNYNPFMLAALLQDKAYDYFETDVTRSDTIDKTALIDMFTKRFDQTALATASAELAKGPDATVIAAVSTTGNSPATGAAGASGAAGPRNTLSVEEQTKLREVLQIMGASPDGKLACPIDKQDTDMSAMAERIQVNARGVFDVHDAAQQHYGNMVLRPEFAWSVPQYRPPVCTSLGHRNPIQPVMDSSRLLLGTPLDDAEDTQVGSIMPKFTYNEYVDVPAAKSS